MNNIRDKAAIVGLGETEFSWDSGRSEIQLACEAIVAACDDAGVSPHEIDGIVRYEMDSNNETMLVQSLGIKNLRHWEAIAYGGGAGNATVAHAAGAIAAGYCNYVVCFRAANLRSGVRLGQARGTERITGGQRGFLAPWGALAPAHLFGMFARRYMHEYGATSRHFGWVAVTLRHHASRNPRALRRQPITIDDHQSSRIIAEPLRLLDFCQENDGAAAIVMTTPDRARHLRHGDTLALVEAAAQGSGPMNEGIVFRPNLAVAESAHTARDLWARAPKTWTPSCSTTTSPPSASSGWRHTVSCLQARPRISWRGETTSGSTVRFRPTPMVATTRRPTSTALPTPRRRFGSSAAHPPLSHRPRRSTEYCRAAPRPSSARQ